MFAKNTHIREEFSVALGLDKARAYLSVFSTFSRGQINGRRELLGGNARMRLTDNIMYIFTVPMVAPCGLAIGIHALLYDCPSASALKEKRMMVYLITVLHETAIYF